MRNFARIYVYKLDDACIVCHMDAFNMHIHALNGFLKKCAKFLAYSSVSDLLSAWKENFMDKQAKCPHH